MDWLLEVNLITRAEFYSPKARFEWMEEYQDSKVTVIMESVEHYCNEIKCQILGVLSCEPPVLYTVPLVLLSDHADPRIQP